MISSINVCKFVQWTASIKLLIMFLLFFDLIENTSFTKNLFYFIILGLNLLHYVCIKLIDYLKEFRSLTENCAVLKSECDRKPQELNFGFCIF